MTLTAVYAGTTDELNGAIATVNGQVIAKTQYQQMLRSNLKPGQTATPELESLVKDEMINRTLLIQYAQKLELDKSPEAQLQWAQLQENFLLDLLTKSLLDAQPISEPELRREYDRQVDVLKNGEAGTQFSVRLIMLQSDAEARETLASLRQGVSFEKLAREKSIDPSKSQGGLVGWVLPNQINPMLANVMVNLPKGSVSAAPIQVQGGWVLLKVEDTRPFKIPAFAESRNELVTALVQARRVELLKKIRSSADIRQ